MKLLIFISNFPKIDIGFNLEVETKIIVYDDSEINLRQKERDIETV